MRRPAALLSSHGGAGGRSIPQALTTALVCPLSKKRLKYREARGSLVSDAVGVAFPVGWNPLSCTKRRKVSQMTTKRNQNEIQAPGTLLVEFLL
ncbi:hypothetical protein PAHAL_9G239700 [Panicum hallii]|uniref:Protein preY, mitochondrial n=1 Tax=Panicum hallii TaxID=206008 RepID=A0A2S3ILZ0_9POAL|nr:protein preY, mitochondrial-like [Panicum hallii]XP_025797603.1 protein preY, mitochondrial-like [Panicum hallii]PAN47177.1 hypothetical protein PAHAL_9G239700 [Panicum hallii]